LPDVRPWRDSPNEEVASNRAIAAIAIAPLRFPIPPSPENGNICTLICTAQGNKQYYCLIKIKPDRVVNPPTLVPTLQANETAQGHVFFRESEVFHSTFTNLSYY
jgi:hypothetical protein